MIFCLRSSNILAADVVAGAVVDSEATEDACGKDACVEIHLQVVGEAFRITALSDVGKDSALWVNAYGGGVAVEDAFAVPWEDVGVLEMAESMSSFFTLSIGGTLPSASRVKPASRSGNTE